MAHLADIAIKVTEGQEIFNVQITFRCHCFTEDFKPAIHTPDLAYHHGGEKRAFCTIRHALSLSLPAYITGLVGKSVYLSNKGSYFIIRANGGNYVAFFNVLRRNGKPYDATVHVETAHLRPQFIQYAHPVRFTALIAAKAKGTPVTSGPRAQIKRG